jgi:hypothetical protein
MPEKIDPISSSEQKKSEKLGSSADPEQFRKLMQISETELDQQRKRKWQGEEDEKSSLEETKSEENTPKGSSPYETSFYQEKTSDKKTPNNEGKVTNKAKSKTELSEDVLDKIDVDKAIKELSKKGKKLTEKDKKLRDDLQISAKRLEEITKGNLPSNDEKTKNLEELEKSNKNSSLFSKSNKDELKKVKDSDSSKDFQLNSYKEFPQDVKILAEAATRSLPPNTTNDVHKLFTHLVGMLIHIDNNGISKTEITLNSPNMVGSIFYGSTITLTKFSTAPNSYNITLKGSPKAVNIFNDNISSLVAAFRKQKYGFEIYKINAELQVKEKPSFHRKEKASKKDSDAGGNFK